MSIGQRLLIAWAGLVDLYLFANRKYGILVPRYRVPEKWLEWLAQPLQHSYCWHACLQLHSRNRRTKALPRFPLGNGRTCKSTLLSPPMRPSDESSPCSSHWWCRLVGPSRAAVRYRECKRRWTGSTATRHCCQDTSCTTLWRIHKWGHRSYMHVPLKKWINVVAYYYLVNPLHYWCRTKPLATSVLPDLSFTSFCT